MTEPTREFSTMDAMFETLHGIGLIPVIKVENADDAVPLCSALMAGGLPIAEITFRTGAAAEAMKKVGAALPDMLMGAGTVTSIDFAEQALDAGAKFIVTPGFNPQVVDWCIERNLPVLPGCTTASEVEAAQNRGLRVVKFFPAEQSGGLARIKALCAPYPAMSFIPTGGIGLTNLVDYLAFPKILACGGSFMVSDALVGEKNWDKITTITRQALDAILGLELRRVGLPAESPAQAEALGTQCAAFTGAGMRDAGASLLIGDGMEIMKSPSVTRGYIGFGVHSVERARYQFRQRGMNFDEASAVWSAGGSLLRIAFAEPLNGFTVCLMRKDA